MYCHNFMGRQLASDKFWQTMLQEPPFLEKAERLRLHLRTAPQDAREINTAAACWQLVLLTALEAGTTKATGRGPRLDLTDLGVDMDHPPLPMEHAVQLTRIPFWKSWPSFFAALIETLPSTVWALAALSASTPVPSPNDTGEQERWLSGIEWGKRFVDEGEALHYLRDLYGPCYLREVFLPQPPEGQGEPHLGHHGREPSESASREDDGASSHGQGSSRQSAHFPGLPGAGPAPTVWTPGHRRPT